MELTTALALGIGLFLGILAPYLVLEIRRGKSARPHVVHLASSHAGTAISDLMWAFATRSRVWMRRAARGTNDLHACSSTI